jgi:hypothetical protein
LLGWQLGTAAIKYKEYERTVNVKGLSEREYPADVVIWPVQFTVADNTLTGLYGAIDQNVEKIRNFLLAEGIGSEELTIASPIVNDVYANIYGSDRKPEFRYTARQTVTVYSSKVDHVRGVMSKIGDLGRDGVVLVRNDYEFPTEYLFTRLNEVKPEMVEEATKAAREVALRFAEDSESKLGKIKNASQGQFSIGIRDANNPHIKTVRVVSTVEYYLSD